MKQMPIVILFVFLLFVHAKAQTPDESLRPSSATRSDIDAPLNLSRADSYLKKAYSDVFGFLSAPNSCSDFYGGPNIAAKVFNEFIARTTKSDLQEDIAFTMKGSFVSHHSRSPNLSYRLFQYIFVNRKGAFYQRRESEFDPRISPIGPFAAGSRAARALILLHELGHLIEAPNHEWLLKDDGEDAYRSRRNTELVLKACRHELKSLN